MNLDDNGREDYDAKIDQQLRLLDQAVNDRSSVAVAAASDSATGRPNNDDDAIAIRNEKEGKDRYLSYVERLETFTPARYFAKPIELSPIVAARFGWSFIVDEAADGGGNARNAISRDGVLTCECCKAKCAIIFPDELLDHKVRIAPAIKQNLVGKYVEQLTSAAHLSWCPYRVIMGGTMERASPKPKSVEGDDDQGDGVLDDDSLLDEDEDSETRVVPIPPIMARVLPPTIVDRFDAPVHGIMSGAVIASLHDEWKRVVDIFVSYSLTRPHRFRIVPDLVDIPTAPFTSVGAGTTPSSRPSMTAMLKAVTSDLFVSSLMGREVANHVLAKTGISFEAFKAMSEAATWFVVCGWAAASTKTDTTTAKTSTARTGRVANQTEDAKKGSDNCLSCSLCLGEWALMPHQKQQPRASKRRRLVQDDGEITKSPLTLHRYYCPYVSGFPHHLTTTEYGLLSGGTATTTTTTPPLWEVLACRLYDHVVSTNMKTTTSENSATGALSQSPRASFETAEQTPSSPSWQQQVQSMFQSSISPRL